jgi:hypothetical protein
VIYRLIALIKAEDREIVKKPLSQLSQAVYIQADANQYR